MVSVPARRRQVAYGRGRGLSARRACTLFSVARSALEYRSRKAAKDAPVVARMKELSAPIRGTAIGASAFSSTATAIASAPAGRTGCGERRGCRCRASGRGSA